MKAIIPIIICLLMLSSCKKDAPDLPPEYDYIKGEWVAYKTTVYTSGGYHGGYIPYTKTIENLDFRLIFYDDRYILRRENVDKVYWLESVELEFSYDTNIVRFVGPSLRYYFYKNEDVIYSSGGIESLFPELWYAEIIGGDTYYRRVQ